MDQIKIGKFISQKRKENNLTQLELAEKLNITDRAISKWETGRSMPDSSIMLKLCETLGISVNDLLTGEVVSESNYSKKLEQNLLELQRQKENSDKRLLNTEVVMLSLTVIIYVFLVLVVSFNEIEESTSLLIIIPLTIFVCMMCFLALKIEQQAGYYECHKCHYKYVPDYKSVFWAAHISRTRYMKCPNCNKRSWQKKVVNK